MTSRVTADASRTAKTALRQEMRERRRAVSQAEAEAAGRQAAALVEEHVILRGPPAPLVALLYAALPGEMDMRAVDAMLRRRGVRVAYPRVAGDAPLELALSTPEALVPAGRFLIPEPATDAPAVRAEELDLVLVPGLAFDARGYRLGFGKGHYDRLLPRAARTVRYGACLPHQLIPHVPDEAHDVAVDFLVVAGAHSGHIIPTSAGVPAGPVRELSVPKENR